MRWVVVMLAGCGLAGCGPAGLAGPAGPVPQDGCGLARVAGLLGQPFVTLADVDLPGPLRVVYPGQELREEAQAHRLTAAVDGAGRIRTLYCG